MVKLACVYLFGLTKSNKGVRQPSTDELRGAYKAWPARWRRSREGLVEASPKQSLVLQYIFFCVDLAKSCVCMYDGRYLPY